MPVGQVAQPVFPKPEAHRVHPEAAVIGEGSYWIVHGFWGVVFQAGNNKKKVKVFQAGNNKNSPDCFDIFSTNIHLFVLFFYLFFLFSIDWKTSWRFTVLINPTWKILIYEFDRPISGKNHKSRWDSFLSQTQPLSDSLFSPKNMKKPVAKWMFQSFSFLNWLKPVANPSNSILTMHVLSQLDSCFFP